MFELIKRSQFSMIIILHRFKFECFFKSSQYIYICIYEFVAYISLDSPFCFQKVHLFVTIYIYIFTIKRREVRDSSHRIDRW